MMDSNRPQLTTEETIAVTRLAQRIIKLSQNKRLAVLVSLLIRQMSLLKEVNAYRLANGVEPIKEYKYDGSD